MTIVRRLLTCVLGAGWIALATAPWSAAEWRNGVSSLWTEKPVVIDGRATEWALMPVQETGGLSFRAMNDQTNLYLLIRAISTDGRILLAGRYRQSVTLWFLKPDHETRDWGILLDFSRATAPSGEPSSLTDLGMTPAMAIPQGLELSTATLSPDIALQTDLSTLYGRQPVYEIKIPLALLARHGRDIYMDFVSSDVSPEVKLDLQNRQPAPPPPSTGSSSSSGSSSPPSGSGGHGGGRHHGGGRAPQNPTAIDVPKALNIHLTIALAKK